ncbi:mitochondrial ribosome-associated GTPase 1 isoform 4-T5 [Cyanocitta cristata]
MWPRGSRGTWRKRSHIPLSGRNPALQEALGIRPHVLVLNKMDLADPRRQPAVLEQLRQQGCSHVVFTDCQRDANVRKVVPMVARLVAESPRYHSAKVRHMHGISWLGRVPQGSWIQPLALPRHPNSPTLGIPGSAAQTLLELWHPRGRDHSLGSLGSAQHPLGEAPFPHLQPEPALTQLQPLPGCCPCPREQRWELQPPVRSDLSVLQLNKPNAPSCSSRPFPIPVSLLWTLSDSFRSLLYCGAPKLPSMLEVRLPQCRAGGGSPPFPAKGQGCSHICQECQQTLGYFPVAAACCSRGGWLVTSCSLPMSPCLPEL